MGVHIMIVYGVLFSTLVVSMIDATPLCTNTDSGGVNPGSECTCGDKTCNLDIGMVCRQSGGNVRMFEQSTGRCDMHLTEQECENYKNTSPYQKFGTVAYWADFPHGCSVYDNAEVNFKASTYGNLECDNPGSWGWKNICICKSLTPIISTCRNFVQTVPTPPCSNTDGTQTNQGTECQCGDIECISETGMVCTENDGSGICSVAPLCVHTDGIMPNTEPCLCGNTATTCNASPGFYCKTDEHDGFGLKTTSGQCEYKLNNIEDCEKAAVAMNGNGVTVTDTVPTLVAQYGEPLGCYVTMHNVLEYNVHTIGPQYDTCDRGEICICELKKDVCSAHPPCVNLEKATVDCVCRSAVGSVDCQAGQFCDTGSCFWDQCADKSGFAASTATCQCTPNLACSPGQYCEASTARCLDVPVCVSKDGTQENAHTCQCDQVQCSAETGTFCYSENVGFCARQGGLQFMTHGGTNIPVCHSEDGSSMNVATDGPCACGNTACDLGTGKYCLSSKNLCDERPICSNRDGSAANPGSECRCHNAMCDTTSGMYCYEHHSVCYQNANVVFDISHGRPAVPCDSLDGSVGHASDNLGVCTCGSKNLLCDENTGLFCYDQFDQCGPESNLNYVSVVLLMDSGSCNSLPLSMQECIERATRLQLTYTLPNTDAGPGIPGSSYLEFYPRGCSFDTSNANLWFNEYGENNNYGDCGVYSRQCVCSSFALPCSFTNGWSAHSITDECKCGTNICSDNTGLYCYGAQSRCSNEPTPICTDPTRTNQRCTCGTTVCEGNEQCYEEGGLCSETDQFTKNGITAPICSSQTGDQRNNEQCFCGTSTCNPNMYCNQDLDLCSPVPVPNCEHANGSQMNTQACMCGTLYCGETFGNHPQLYCYASENRCSLYGTCAQVDGMDKNSVSCECGSEQICHEEPGTTEAYYDYELRTSGTCTSAGGEFVTSVDECTHAIKTLFEPGHNGLPGRPEIASATPHPNQVATNVVGGDVRYICGYTWQFREPSYPYTAVERPHPDAPFQMVTFLTTNGQHADNLCGEDYFGSGGGASMYYSNCICRKPRSNMRHQVGLFCHTSTQRCETSEICSNTDGTVANKVVCYCGNMQCTASMPYCYGGSAPFCASKSGVQMNDASVPVCERQDGSSAHIQFWAKCACGGSGLCEFGTYCNNGVCHDHPACESTDGNQVTTARCSCGSSNCAAGQICNNGACQWPVCSQINGLTSTLTNCKCTDSLTCKPGEYCHAATSKCNDFPECQSCVGDLCGRACSCNGVPCPSNAHCGAFGCDTSALPTCQHTDGILANPSGCKCGTAECHAWSSGLFCNQELNLCTAHKNAYDVGKYHCEAIDGSGPHTHSNACRCWTLPEWTAFSDSDWRKADFPTRYPYSTFQHCTQATGLVCNQDNAPYISIGTGYCDPTEYILDSKANYDKNRGVSYDLFPRLRGSFSDAFDPLWDTTDRVNECRKMCGSTSYRWGDGPFQASLGFFTRVSDQRCACSKVTETSDGTCSNAVPSASYQAHRSNGNVYMCTHAPDCPNKDGTVENTGACKCGDIDCSAESGLYCIAGRSYCASLPPCDPGLLNSESCSCGSSQCDANMYCHPSSNQCAEASFFMIDGVRSPVCSIVDGSGVNDGYPHCACGSTICTVTTGLFCIEDASTCVTAQVCNYKSGAKANAGECFCGPTLCTQASGFYCDQTGNEPVCLETAVRSECDKSNPNQQECGCGADTCTKNNGLVCNIDGMCSHAAVCEYQSGGMENNRVCKCGAGGSAIDCTVSSGYYCYASSNQCDKRAGLALRDVSHNGLTFQILPCSNGKNEYTCACGPGNAYCDNPDCSVALSQCSSNGLYTIGDFTGKACEHVDGVTPNTQKCICEGDAATHTSETNGTFYGCPVTEFCSEHLNQCSRSQTFTANGVTGQNCQHQDGTVANNKECMCHANGETRGCGIAAGTVCSNGLCSHAQVCEHQDGAVVNDGPCQCGALDCIAEFGYYCVQETCAKYPVCAFQGGLRQNTDRCLCGTALVDCKDGSQYCYGDINQCSADGQFGPIVIGNKVATAKWDWSQNSKKCDDLEGGSFIDNREECDEAFDELAANNVWMGNYPTYGYLSIPDNGYWPQNIHPRGCSQLTVYDMNVRLVPSPTTWTNIDPHGYVRVLSTNQQPLFQAKADHIQICRQSVLFSGPVCPDKSSTQVIEHNCMCSVNVSCSTGQYCDGSVCSDNPVCPTGEPHRLTNECQCGNSQCTRSTGLLCNETCGHAPACDHTDGSQQNNGVCKCGALDCNDVTGLFCDDGVCRALPNCAQDDGHTLNSDKCLCGPQKTECDSNHMCYGKLSMCSADGQFSTVVDGSTIRLPICQDPSGVLPTQEACICGLLGGQCQFEPGLYCLGDENRCSEHPLCVHGQSHSATVGCRCVDDICDENTGFVCNSVCSHAPTCEHTDGRTANGATCQCGTRDCNGATGLFCSEDLSQCSAYPICTHEGGEHANAEPCLCGEQRTVCPNVYSACYGPLHLCSHSNTFTVGSFTGPICDDQVGTPGSSIDAPCICGTGTCTSVGEYCYSDMSQCYPEGGLSIEKRFVTLTSGTCSDFTDFHEVNTELECAEVIPGSFRKHSPYQRYVANDDAQYCIGRHLVEIQGTLFNPEQCYDACIQTTVDGSRATGMTIQRERINGGFLYPDSENRNPRKCLCERRSAIHHCPSSQRRSLSSDDSHYSIYDITEAFLKPMCYAYAGVVWWNPVESVIDYFTYTPSCQADNACVCAFTGPVCVHSVGKTANTRNCVCGESVCTVSSAQPDVYCFDGMCSETPEFTADGQSSETCDFFDGITPHGSSTSCVCTATTFCTSKTGLICNSANGGNCSHAEDCEHTLGRQENNGTCQCGNKDCITSETYCYEPWSTCSTIPMFPCVSSTSYHANGQPEWYIEETSYNIERRSVGIVGHEILAVNIGSDGHEFTWKCTSHPAMTGIFKAASSGATSSHIYVSAGSVDPPYYRFYSNSNCQDGEIVAQSDESYNLLQNTQYTFHRCGNIGTHPFDVYFPADKDAFRVNQQCLCDEFSTCQANEFCFRDIGICAAEIPCIGDGITATTQNCACGNHTCESGQYCDPYSNQCQNEPFAFTATLPDGSVFTGGVCRRLVDDKNSGMACVCGTTVCDPEKGLICQDNQCAHAPMCTNTNGTNVNSNVCQCGRKQADCAKEYCYEYNEALTHPGYRCDPYVDLTKEDGRGGSYALRLSPTDPMYDPDPAKECANRCMEEYGVTGFFIRTINDGKCACGDPDINPTCLNRSPSWVGGEVPISTSTYPFQSYQLTSMCEDIPRCPHEDGITKNSHCKCGAEYTACDVNDAYCYGPLNQCSSDAVFSIENYRGRVCTSRDGMNNNNHYTDCVCGTTVCDGDTGMYCYESTNMCAKGPPCEKVSGLEENSATCVCNTRQCDADTGLYCYGSESQCVKGPPCTHEMGLVANAKICTCGVNTCEPYAVFTTGSCGENGTVEVQSQEECEDATRTLGKEDLSSSLTAPLYSVKDWGTYIRPKCFVSGNDDTKVYYNTNPSTTGALDLGFLLYPICKTPGHYCYKSYNNMCSGTGIFDGKPSCSHRDGQTPSPEVCICSTETCSEHTGLVCNATANGQCSHADPCVHSEGIVRNDDTCGCGSVDCPQSKPFCHHSNTCDAIGVCPFQNGTIKNDQRCWCDTVSEVLCESNSYCYSALKQCSKQREGFNGYGIMTNGHCEDVGMRSISLPGECELALVDTFQSDQSSLDTVPRPKECSMMDNDRVLVTPMGVELTFSLRQSGKCETPIMTRSECIGAAEAVGWNPSSLNIVETRGSYNPEGCVKRHIGGYSNSLLINANYESVECNGPNWYTTEYQTCVCYDSKQRAPETLLDKCGPAAPCICGFEGHICDSLDGEDAHQTSAKCVCGTYTQCTPELGLVCQTEMRSGHPSSTVQSQMIRPAEEYLHGTCSHADPCVYRDGLLQNPLTCQCADTDCNIEDGLYCNELRCSKYAACQNSDGTQANDAVCTCGRTVCSHDSGLFCHTALDQCSPDGIFEKQGIRAAVCDEIDGVIGNPSTCFCGSDANICKPGNPGLACRASGECVQPSECSISSGLMQNVGIYSCACGTTDCWSDSGFYCYESLNQCSPDDQYSFQNKKYPACRDATQPCLCGANVSLCDVGDPGLACNAAISTCERPPVCTNIDGTSENTDVESCACGTTDCWSDSGFYCYESLNQCSTTNAFSVGDEILSPCEHRGGLLGNADTCLCGDDASVCAQVSPGLACIAPSSTCFRSPVCKVQNGSLTNNVDSCACGAVDCLSKAGTYCLGGIPNSINTGQCSADGRFAVQGFTAPMCPLGTISATETCFCGLSYAKCNFAQNGPFCSHGISQCFVDVQCPEGEFWEGTCECRQGDSMTKCTNGICNDGVCRLPMCTSNSAADIFEPYRCDCRRNVDSSQIHVSVFSSADQYFCPVGDMCFFPDGKCGLYGPENGYPACGCVQTTIPACIGDGVRMTVDYSSEHICACGDTICREGEYCNSMGDHGICSTTSIGSCVNTDGTSVNTEACICNGDPCDAMWFCSATQKCHHKLCKHAYEDVDGLCKVDGYGRGVLSATNGVEPTCAGTTCIQRDVGRCCETCEGSDVQVYDGVCRRKCDYTMCKGTWVRPPVDLLLDTQAARAQLSQSSNNLFTGFCDGMVCNDQDHATCCLEASQCIDQDADVLCFDAHYTGELIDKPCDDFACMAESCCIGIVCQCPHGTPAVGLACDTQGSVTCVACDGDRYLLGSECENRRICEEGQFEIITPDAHTDRQCTGVTMCEPGEYEATAPTLTSDRTCVPHTQCTLQEYVIVEGNETMDRQCAPLAVCTTTQYEAPNRTHNRVCLDVTMCNDGEYEVTAPSATRDRTCTAYAVMCQPNEYEWKPQTPTNDRTCRPLTVCSTSEFIIRSHNETSDRLCQNATICDESFEYEIRFMNGTSDRQCATLTQCSDREWTSRPKTQTSDRQCSLLTVCSSNEYEARVPNATRDRACQTCNFDGCDGCTTDTDCTFNKLSRLHNQSYCSELTCSVLNLDGDGTIPVKYNHWHRVESERPFNLLATGIDFKQGPNNSSYFYIGPDLDGSVSYRYTDSEWNTFETVRDCEYGIVSRSQCNGVCGSGQVLVIRGKINRQPENGGDECPKKMFTEACERVDNCPVDCEMEFNDDFGSCIGECGETGKRYQAYNITRISEYGGEACPDIPFEICNVEPSQFNVSWCNCKGDVFDGCDVCGGKNQSCLDCEGRLQPDAFSRKRFDACGVCGGDGTSCETELWKIIVPITAGVLVVTVIVLISVCLCKKSATKAKKPAKKAKTPAQKTAKVNKRVKSIF